MTLDQALETLVAMYTSDVQAVGYPWPFLCDLPRGAALDWERTIECRKAWMKVREHVRAKELARDYG